MFQRMKANSWLMCVSSLKAQETPLHIAARVKEGERVAEMLLKSGADVNAQQEVGQKGAPQVHSV